MHRKRSSSQRLPPLAESFFNRSPQTVAQELIGKQLIHQTAEGICRGRIVETEAYLARDDSACHSARGKTRKNASMFGPPGHAYVYAIHSRWCFNVVTEPESVASAVLIRALEPLDGIPWMQQRRGTMLLRDLARGPGRLCEAMAIGRNLDGWNLMRGETLWLADDSDFERSSQTVGCSPRIGVTSAKSLPLRFFLGGCEFVSGTKKANTITQPSQHPTS